MAEWKFVITEHSTFYVELDTSNEEEAYSKIREMVLSGEIDITKPDYYENVEDVIPV